MDETTRSVIEKIRVPCEPPMTLPGGRSCRVFYDCARLTTNDYSRLAAEAVGDIDEHCFDAVVALAYSGILFAAAVASGKSVSILQADGGLWGPAVRGQSIILVDDVVYTGARMRSAAERLSLLGALVTGYACIIDRSEGKVGTPALPLWSAYQTAME
jgi:orotate phosphoribosyltransferase